MVSMLSLRAEDKVETEKVEHTYNTDPSPLSIYIGSGCVPPAEYLSSNSTNFFVFAESRISGLQGAIFKWSCSKCSMSGTKRGTIAPNGFNFTQDRVFLDNSTTIGKTEVQHLRFQDTGGITGI